MPLYRVLLSWMGIGGEPCGGSAGLAARWGSEGAAKDKASMQDDGVFFPQLGAVLPLQACFMLKGCCEAEGRWLLTCHQRGCKVTDTG